MDLNVIWDTYHENKQKKSVQTGSWFCIAEINRNSLNNSRVLDSKTYAQPVQDVPHQ